MKNVRLIDILPECIGYDVYIYHDGKSTIITSEHLCKAIALLELGFTYDACDELGRPCCNVSFTLAKRKVIDVVYVVGNFYEISLK